MSDELNEKQAVEEGNAGGIEFTDQFHIAPISDLMTNDPERVTYDTRKEAEKVLKDLDNPDEYTIVQTRSSEVTNAQAFQDQYKGNDPATVDKTEDEVDAELATAGYQAPVPPLDHTATDPDPNAKPPEEESSDNPAPSAGEANPSPAPSSSEASDESRA